MAFLARDDPPLSFFSTKNSQPRTADGIPYPRIVAGPSLFIKVNTSPLPDHSAAWFQPLF